MASTTLVTFILNSVHATTAVDVLGSWDNFSKPYPMQKDLQKGHGSWYGCHVFKNIICDGDPADCCMPRDGGLVMGGTYWYYFRRNFDQEFHNPDQPSTSNCPLLPGQKVNVLVVPKDPLAQSNCISKETQTASSPSHMTMDPNDRFRTPIRASKKDQAVASTTADSIPIEARLNPLYSSTLARLQTGVGDTVISAYLQHKRPEDLISWRHPAVERSVRSSHSLLPASQSLRSGNLQRRTTRRRKDTTGGTRPVSRLGIHSTTELDLPLLAKVTREYTNPFLLDTIQDDAAQEIYQKHRQLFHVCVQLDRPITSGGPGRPSTSHAFLRRSCSSPAALPSGSLPESSPKSNGTCISAATKTADIKEEPFEQASVEPRMLHDPQMEFLNHPPENLHQQGQPQVLMPPSSPEMTPGSTTPSNVRPLTRSKSQKLKRLASLKSIIKLPHVPSMPKLKSRRPSTRHEPEEAPGEKRAVFNETSSTWTPAMTSPSDSSPGFVSPEIKPVARKLQADSPMDNFSIPLSHQKPLSGEDRIVSSSQEKSRKQSRPMRGDSLPRLVNNFLPGAFSDQPSSNPPPRAHYPTRGSSLPHLLSDARGMSSQETIRHASGQPGSARSSQKSLGQSQTSALAEFEFGLSKERPRRPSAFFFEDDDEVPMLSCDDARESFDETVHRDQIRHLLRDGTSFGLHELGGLSTKASFGGATGLGQDHGPGPEKEEGFGPESFEYLAAAIY